MRAITEKICLTPEIRKSGILLYVFLSMTLSHSFNFAAPAGVTLPDVDKEFLIGKAIDPITDAKYADMIIDEFEFWTADRQTLLDYNFIQRG